MPPLPEGAAKALAADLPGKMGMSSEPTPSEDDGAKPETDVMHEIAGDVIDAIQAGSREEATKYLVELIERACSQYEADEGPEPDEG